VKSEEAEQLEVTPLWLESLALVVGSSVMGKSTVFRGWCPLGSDIRSGRVSVQTAAARALGDSSDMLSS
jgi:hypothetical protein